MERIEQMYWHPKGVIIALPTEASSSIAQSTGVNTCLDPLEQTRLRIIANDSILNKRYPTILDGRNYMSQVDYEWHTRLYAIAEEASETIKQACAIMGKRDIAVVLFGSVAKMLSRSLNHPDPSNVDIAVIDRFSGQEKNELFERIRPYRKHSEAEIGNNLGVHVHHTDQLKRGDYHQALHYISSSAKTLYDPVRIWQTTEREALTYRFLKDAYRTTCEQVRYIRRRLGIDRSNHPELFMEIWNSIVSQIEINSVQDVFLRAAIENPQVLRKGRDRFTLPQISLVA